jgi:hypothetical protein
VPGRYHGLVRHSASVPEAEAWQAPRLLKEQPLQPGLSTPWMQKGYCDMQFGEKPECDQSSRIPLQRAAR